MNGFNQTIGSLRNGGSTPSRTRRSPTRADVLSTLTVNETGTATYGGIITGNLALVKNGAGTMILTQSNRHTGGTTVNEGILRIGSSGALAGGNVTAQWRRGTAGGLLDLNNLSPTINSLNGAAGTVSAIIANESTVNDLRTLTVGVNHGSGSFAGNIVDNTGGLALGRVALTKIGAGTQTLLRHQHLHGRHTAQQRHAHRRLRHRHRAQQHLRHQDAGRHPDHLQRHHGHHRQHHPHPGTGC
jgi:fibronectin-binding autotransporter adhesin